MMRSVFVVALALGAAGCGNSFVVTDSFTAPPANGGDLPDSLHDYVVGTPVTLSIRPSRPLIDVTKVKVVSKNPDLVSVDDQSASDGVITAKLHAVKAGTAAIDFLDDNQRPIEERVLQVKQPDKIALAVDMDPARGYTIPSIDPLNLIVAAGGQVTFRVTYTKGGAELSGAGVLVGKTTLLTVRNPTKNAPDRELLTLLAPPVSAGPKDVELDVAGLAVTTLSARIADLSEIKVVQLDEGAKPDVQEDGQVYTVWAKSFTKDAQPVFGAPFQWSFDSSALDPGTGDDGEFMSYTRKSGDRHFIQVSSGDVVSSVEVEAKPGTAQIGDADSAFGCAATPGAPFALVAVLAVCRRRRRRCC
jgi:hypothetical protein